MNAGRIARRPQSSKISILAVKGNPYDQPNIIQPFEHAIMVGPVDFGSFSNPGGRLRPFLRRDRGAACPVSTFDGYECTKIASEGDRISARMTELRTEVDETADDDELMTTVGILVFPPLLFFLKGDGAEADDYGRLKGEYVALQEVAAQKQCPGNPA